MTKGYAGIDIGSRTIELLVVDDELQVREWHQADTGFDPLTVVKELIERVTFERIMATGYGRTLFELAFDAPTVTEIKAHARGARAHFPDCQALLDIGGQDSKAMTLFPTGRVKKFEMNDRCAAGTGKFLEIMARSLGYSIDEFGQAALAAEQDLTISSMCTVFAESEVTSLIASGEDRRAIARGLHASVVRRAVGMIKRVSAEGDIVFTGGVAKNPCVVALLAEKLGCQVFVPDNPDYVGALGAAILAAEG